MVNDVKGKEERAICSDTQGPRLRLRGALCGACRDRFRQQTPSSLRGPRKESERDASQRGWRLHVFGSILAWDSAPRTKTQGRASRALTCSVARGFS